MLDSIRDLSASAGYLKLARTSTLTLRVASPLGARHINEASRWEYRLVQKVLSIVLSALLIVFAASACVSTETNGKGGKHNKVKRGGPTFGEPRRTTVTSSYRDDIPLLVTVSAPAPFTPSDPADAKRADNIYFTVTIKNLSETETFDAGSVLTDAISGLSSEDPDVDIASGKGVSGYYILDFDQNIAGVGGAEDTEIDPGQSLTFKDGFSVASADGVTFELRPAGLAGETLLFQAD